MPLFVLSSGGSGVGDLDRFGVPDLLRLLYPLLGLLIFLSLAVLQFLVLLSGPSCASNIRGGLPYT